MIKHYQTKYEQGKTVTFRHEEHVNRFGFKCVSCHREQTCSRCHIPKDFAPRTKTFTEHHAPCAFCHQTGEDKKESCAHCHSDQEIPPFSHEKTGLALDEAHKDAECSDCHVSTKAGKFGEKPTCSSCHEDAEKITYPEKLPGKKVSAP